MAEGGEYTVQLQAILNTKGVSAQIAQIQKQAGKVIIGGAGTGKGAGGFAAIGKEANRTAAGVRRLNGAIGATGKNVKKIEGRKLAGVYTDAGKSAKQATSNIKSFGSTTLDVTKKVVQFGAVTAVIRGVTSGIGSMVQQTFELDGALVEFKKVSDLSTDGLKKYTKQAYEAGRETAKTGVEMIDAATQFKKMGYDEQTSLQLAKHATMFQNIADSEISAGEAAKFINSQMKAYQGEFSKFGSEGEKAAKVIDTVNEVANKNAVGTNDLQLALTKTSAAMGGFGNSFDEVVGIMTAGTEIMVGMPSQVARGWRTIGANILKIAQDSDEYVAASGKVQIATRDQNGEMKNTYAIMKDLYEGIDGVSTSWKDLSKEEQSAIALELGGKNNMEKFRAVMDNFGTAIKATTEAQESHGSATKENAKYLDSLEGRLQAAKSAWSRFSNAMVNSESVKGVLSGLAKTLEFLSSDFGQVMIKAGGAIGIFVGAVKLLNAVRGAQAFTNIIGGAGKLAREIGISTKALGKFKRALGGMSSTSLIGIAAIAGTIAYGMYQAYKSTHKYRNEVKDLSKANRQNIDAIDNNAKSAQFYADKIEELSKVEDKSIAEKERMAAYVERLNELMPGLNLEYNKEKDALNKSTEAIREYIKAKQEEAKVKAYQDNFEKSLNKQVKLEEKRADAIKEMQRAQEQYDKAVQSGNLDKLTQDRYNKAKGALKDLTIAYAEATKETTKQSNNMLKASGDWDALVKNAKESGVKISDGVKSGIEDGIYAIPKTVQGLENLNLFNDLANKLDVTSAGASLVDALQQGMREGHLKPSEALDIAKDFQNIRKDIGKEGTKTVEELSSAFANGEIDFSTFKKEINELTNLKAKPKVEVEGAQEAQSALISVTKDMNSIERQKVLAEIGVEGAVDTKEEVEAVNKYLNEINGNNPSATVTINGVEHAVSDVESVSDRLAIMDGDTSRAKLTIDTDGDGELDATKDTMDEMDGRVDTSTLKVTAKGGEQISALSDDLNEIPDTTNTTVIATGDVEPSVSEVTALSATPPVIERTFVVTGEDNGAMPLYQQVEGAKINPKTMTVKGKTDGSFTSAKSKYEGVPRSRKATLTVGGRIAASLTNAIAKMKSALSLGGKAKGTRNAPEGLSEVNEEGWEFIRDHKTGQLRIAGGGQRTVTYLNKGDIVYTHAESKRMVVEGKDVKIPQHAKGKNNNKKKEAQDAYNNSWEKRKTNYEDAIAALEYQAKVKNWTDEALAKKVRATYNAHIKYLKSWNAKNATVKKWKRQGAKVKSTFGAEVAREVHLREVEAAHDKRIQSLEKSIESLGLSAKSSFLTAAATNTKVAQLTAHHKAGRITLEEYNKLKADVYKSYIEGMMALHKVNKKSYKSMRTDLLNYAQSGKITWAEYYDYLDDLMDEQLDKQKKYLESLNDKQKNTYSLATSWVDRQIERLERQNEETSEQNELIEKQNELERARSTRVKVYRQGQGFVYEQDVQAVKEATSELQKEQKKQESPELKAWKDVKQLLEDLELDASIKNYEVLVGKSFEQLFGSYGVDLSKWADFAKNNLAMQHGYENLIDKLDDLEGWEDISAYLDSDGKIKADIINNSIAKNRFATGALSTPAGFARVAEQGYEIALFGKGDAVMPHSVSENLMAWGAQSPVEYADSINQNATNQIYHFDNLVLPNVTNANTFMRELNNLPNKALQYSRGRA